MSDDIAPATMPTNDSSSVTAPSVVTAGGSLHAVTLDDATLATVDRWASQWRVSRAEALGRLIEIGLNAARGARPSQPIAPDRAFELATSQIYALIDPEAPLEERDRRVARLTEGPPEFVAARVDLPRRRATDVLPPDDSAAQRPVAPGTPQRRATDRSALPD